MFVVEADIFHKLKDKLDTGCVLVEYETMKPALKQGIHRNKEAVM